MAVAVAVVQILMDVCEFHIFFCLFPPSPPPHLPHPNPILFCFSDSCQPPLEYVIVSTSARASPTELMDTVQHANRALAHVIVPPSCM